MIEEYQSVHFCKAHCVNKYKNIFRIQYLKYQNWQLPQKKSLLVEFYLLSQCTNE